MSKEVGKLSEKVIAALGLPLPKEQPILLGDSNVTHMQRNHPDDYNKYGRYIPDILSSPDYVGQNPTDGSVEYVKDFAVDGEYVKVAVRVSGGGTLYARSLYVLKPNRVENFIKKGTLKKV